jgi:hypothetical protein
MSNLDKILKDFKIPKLDEVSAEDGVLISEYLKTQNPMYMVGVMLRLLGNNKNLSNTIISMTAEINALIEVNDSFIVALDNHEKRISAVENKLKSIYVIDGVSKIH